MNRKISFLKKHLSMRTRFFRQSLLMNCLLLVIPILFIGPYTILKSSRDNTKSIQKSVTQTLNQCDSIMDTLFSHVNNANIFFSSNPRVTIQLEKAFREKSLSLSSLKNIENLSLYFQNLIFTDSYIKDIYVYYDNPYNRIYIPQRGAIQTYPELGKSSMMKTYFESDSRDFWIEVQHPQLSTQVTPDSDSLFFYQRLYTRTTHQPVGVILFEYNLKKLIKYFDTLGQYDSQVLYLIDDSQQLIYTDSTAPDLSAELAELLPMLSQTETQDLFNITVNGIPCQAAYLKSNRTNGLTYFTYVPSREIYKSTQSLSRTYGLLMLCAVITAFLLAFYKSNREYRYLNSILDIFSNPAASQRHFETMSKSSPNPFEYIIFNIIRLFVQQDYMKIQDMQKEYKIQMLKMQALQHQINPHFLHNTLNSIYWESIKLTSSENPCSSMVSNLSFVMRYSLSDPQENVKIDEEVNYLRKYLEIMKIRYPDKFHIEYRLDPYCTIFPIKKMVLQPLVENSIYHGIKEKDGIGKICIGVKKLRKSMVFYIYDNGTGIEASMLAQIKAHLQSHDEHADCHIGLVNTNLRLQLAYGDQAGLRIKSSVGKYTLIYFYINYEK